MSQTSGDTPGGVLRTRQLLQLSLPALLIGVASALTLWLLDELAHLLQQVWWQTLPAALGVDPDGWWVVLILTLTGAAVGLVVWLVPGHGGTDSATTELVAPTLPVSALPSVALVVVLALAGGVSLGPESPIIAINTAIAVAVVARLWSAVPTELVVVLAAAGTIGALFGTPVAAALVFTGILAATKAPGSLWDKLFLPLVAAGAGSIVASMVGGGISMTAGIPAYQPENPAIEALWGIGIACAAAALALVGIAVFPHVHRLFRRLRNPVIYTALGGLILGLLGLLGGPLTLFKGLEQSAELLANPDAYSPAQLAVITVVKLAALVVAAAAGFRGGRIFPAVFIGVALGTLAHALIPGLPLGLAVACGVLGLTLAVSRDGWIALFIAVAISGDITLLPVMCVVILPAWLIVRVAPEMIVHPKKQEPSGAQAASA
ncbi:H+/Cl- antiporter ClcA [Microbacterium halimionae]|uniref:H+/Cl- antiporter ClcA n=1 Tax=Microbacterium halimionae TaxID=1526413 RepID=A0A7W3PLV3_9MICO|nr:ion channel protein [Microbacterium halimionae]MBA8816960.1 H+/Cl- antiporter ClcA [Microbacterium halimionae]NII94501.1 H+/Cl- antiporter ClcA [Microbacterium halimionae]